MLSGGMMLTELLLHVVYNLPVWMRCPVPGVVLVPHLWY